MFDEPFTLGPSPLHSLDPRARLATALIWSVAVALFVTPASAWVALILSIILGALSRPPLKPLVSRLLGVNVFIVFLWVLVPFTQPGDPIYKIFGFTASRQGIMLVLLVTLKCNAIALSFIALVASIPISELGAALRGLHAPAKLAYLLVFTYRFVFVMAGEYHRMRQAMKIRAFTPHTNLHTYRSLAYLAGMVLVRGMDRAERVHAAMLCRGFNGTFRSFNSLVARPRDTVFFVLTLAMGILLTLYDRGLIRP